jgi:hypothetical protein
MKKLKTIITLCMFFSINSFSLEAVIFTLKTNNVRIEFSHAIKKLNELNINNFIQQYSIQKILLKFTNEQDEVLEQELNGAKEAENANEWKTQMLEFINPSKNRIMDDGAKTEILMPQHWKIKSLEISYNNYPFELINEDLHPNNTAAFMSKLAKNENIELNIGYYYDPNNGPYINIFLNN